jgi:DNA-binding MarR family transcriptional regulator
VKDAPLTIAQARTLSFLFEGAKAGPELRAKLGLGADETGNFSQFMDRLCRAGYVTRHEDPEDRRLVVYGGTEAGRAAFARTFDGPLAGSCELVPATAHEPPNRDYKPFIVEAADPSNQPDGKAVAALQTAFARLDAPFTRHIARYLPRGEVQEEARQALDELRKAITAITGGGTDG